jgi:hypothetical protein
LEGNDRLNERCVVNEVGNVLLVTSQEQTLFLREGFLGRIQRRRRVPWRWLMRPEMRWWERRRPYAVETGVLIPAVLKRNIELLKDRHQ